MAIPIVTMTLRGALGYDRQGRKIFSPCILKNRLKIGVMQAKKVFLETDRSGRILHPPDLPPNSRMEVIFLILEKKNMESGHSGRRRPSQVIRGKGRILGDIVSPIVPPEDWDVLQ